MFKRRGADDLGIQVDWQFEFVGHGEVLSSRPDTVALDVGNRLESGVLDQHQDRGLGPSTSVLILEHPALVYDHLMTPWLRRADDGVALEGKVWSPVITTHRAPDFDGVVSALLVRELVEKGTLPPWGESLARFAAAVDQGHWTFSADKPLRCKSVALAFYAIDNEVLGRFIDDAARMKIGLALVEGEAAHLLDKKARLTSGDFEDWYGEHCGGWMSASEDARKIARALVDDLDVFEKEKASGLFEERSVEVPVAGTGAQKTMSVKATIVSKKSNSRLLKYWVRGSGCPMLIEPKEFISSNAPSSDPDRQPRVILSLDPNHWDEKGRRPSLDGLGYRLELEECEVRQAAGTETRSGTPRYENVTNNDPWYDGRGHEFGIVDSPRTGTAISYRRIVALATGGRFWQRTVSLSIVVHRACSGKAQAPAAEPQDHPKPEGLGVGCAPIFKDLVVSPCPTDEQLQNGREFWGRHPGPDEMIREATDYLSWNVCSAFYIEKTTWAYHEGSDLDVHGWLQALRRSDSSVFFVIRYLGETDQVQGKELFHKTAERLLAFSAEETPRHQIDELLYNSGRETFAVCAGKELVWEDLVGTQLVLAMYHGLLSYLLGRATAKPGLPDPKEARHLASQINDVLARYAVQELSGVPNLQKMARMTREQLELGAMTERMRHESNALDNHVEKDQGRKMEFFLFLLGLMGLIGATNGIASLTTLAWGYSFAIVCAAVALAIWGLWAYQIGPWNEKKD